MPRQPNKTDVSRLSRAIRQEPGRRKGFFARLFNWPREKVARYLVTLNDDGELFYEDDDGRLYPFDPTRWD